MEHLFAEELESAAVEQSGQGVSQGESLGLTELRGSCSRETQEQHRDTDRRGHECGEDQPGHPGSRTGEGRQDA